MRSKDLFSDCRTLYGRKTRVLSRDRCLLGLLNRNCVGYFCGGSVGSVGTIYVIIGVFSRVQLLFVTYFSTELEFLKKSIAKVFQEYSILFLTMF